MAFKFQHILTLKKNILWVVSREEHGLGENAREQKVGGVWETGEESALGQSVTEGEKQGEMGKLCSNT